MGFDDILGQSNKHNKHGNYSPYGHDDNNQSTDSSFEDKDIKQLLLSKLRENPKLKAMQDFNKNLDKSDAILVANFEKHEKKHYIGANSLMEIGMAFNKNKKIFILYDIPEEYKDELSAIGCIILKGDLTKIR